MSLKTAFKRSMRPLGLAALALLFCGGFAFLYPAQGKADALPVVHESGTLSSSQTWTAGNVYYLDNTVYIPSGVTLTIQAGAVVKIASGWWNTGLYVNGGTLSVSGTSGNQVVFTSGADDSIGGDSNGDGYSTPSQGDYGYAIAGYDSSNINVQFASFNYGHMAYQDNCGTTSRPTSLTMTDSRLYNPIYVGSCYTDAVSLQRNQFSIAQGQGYAIQANNIDVSGIVLAGANENTFSGSGQAVAISLNRSYVATGGTWSIDSASGAVLDVQTFNVFGTMNLGAGTIVKYFGSQGSIYVNQRGALNGTGTASSRIIFTSDKDDTVGGDTNGDGSSTAGNTDYSVAVTPADSSTVNIAFATFAHGGQAVAAGQCSSPTGVNITITDSNIGGNVSMAGCTTGALSLARNQFNIPANVVASAVSITNIDPSGIILSGADENTFTGTGPARVISLSNAGIPSSSNWSVDGSSEAVLDPNNLNVWGTLTLTNGAIVKLENQSTIYAYSGSTVNTTGNSSSPVIFTTMKDDSVGGDSNADGVPTGSVSNSSTAITATSATLQMDYVTFQNLGALASITDGKADIRHANAHDMGGGMSVGGAAHVIYRGNVQNIGYRFISACNWGQSCDVDAAYTNWNSANGPFVSGGTDLVCGAVTVSPWITGSTTATADTFGSANCDNSQTPPTQEQASVTSFDAAVQSNQTQCNNGYQDFCDAVNREFQCLDAAINLAASQSPIPVHFTNPTETVDTVSSDAATAINTAVQGTESESPFAFALDVHTQLLSAINLLSSLKSSYDSCH